MATRRARCTQCGRPMLVPLEAHTISILCSGCQGFSFPQARPNYPFVNNTPPFTNYHPLPAHGRGRHDQFYHHHHQPWPLRASSPPPSAYGNKRAVLFGINYGNKVNRLKGSVNDVQCMKYFLIEKLGFPSDSIRMLTDDPDERNPLRIPTKYNMRMAMRWLVEGCQPGDSLVFHFSGHGSREVDLNMDEVDGVDEAICPVDYEQEGKIIDDEINATIVRPLPHGAKLHAVIDTCFSGTVLDLPFMCRMNRKGYYGWEDHRHPRAGYKGTRGGLAVCISACDDDGNAADTSAFSGMESSGALTYSFIQAMQDEPKLTYGRLLNVMRSTIRGAKEGTFGPNYQEHALNNRQQYAHEPQLSSSEKFDIYSKPVVM
ncbi:Caspase-like domain superfamily [Sesbania bispinosa]|nr:Caspase-like domain superfamily [Sesbania bispinosa]